MKKDIRHQQIGYVRVSSLDQNTARQLDNMELDRVFTDKCSGKDTKRPELQRLIEYARAVDTVHVHSIDRTARLCCSHAPSTNIIFAMIDRGGNSHD